MKTFYSLNKGRSLFFDVYSRKAEGGGGGIVLIELVLCVSCFYLELCFSEQQQQTL